MKKFSNFLYSKSNVYYCLAATILMVLYASLVMGSSSKIIDADLIEGQKILGLLISYDFETVNSLFQSMGHRALDAYAGLLTVWDNIFPLLYGSMYLLWLSLIYKSFRSRWRLINMINLYPLLPMILDFCENFFEYRLLNHFMLSNEISIEEVHLTSGITSVKWFLSLLNYLLILAGIILLLVRIRKRGIVNSKD